eukprot:5003031-Pyramimonas_sp.AAC.1
MADTWRHDPPQVWRGATKAMRHEGVFARRLGEYGSGRGLRHLGGSVDGATVCVALPLLRKGVTRGSQGGHDSLRCSPFASQG